MNHSSNESINVTEGQPIAGIPTPPWFVEGESIYIHVYVVETNLIRASYITHTHIRIIMRHKSSARTSAHARTRHKSSRAHTYCALSYRASYCIISLHVLCVRKLTDDLLKVLGFVAQDSLNLPPSRSCDCEDDSSSCESRSSADPDPGVVTVGNYAGASAAWGAASSGGSASPSSSPRCSRA